MKKLRQLMTIFLALSITMLVGCSSSIVGIKRLSNENWIEDIDYLDNTMKYRHPDLFRNISEEEWDQNINELKENVGELSDIDIGLSISQIISSIQDAHTIVDIFSVMTPIGKDTIGYEDIVAFPFRYEWFDDGLRVNSCLDDYKEVLGYKLVSINNISTDEIIKKLFTIVSYDNEQSAKSSAIEYMTIYEVLRFLDIVDKQEAKFVFEDDNKEEVTLKVKPQLNKDIKFTSLDHKIFKTEEKPEGARDEYWFKPIEEDNSLYFQYNSCISNNATFLSEEDRSKYPNFHEFEEELIDYINDNNFDKFVIDLRKNGGGSMGLTSSLIMKLKSNTDIEKSKIYVITGKNTFSAGAISAWHLKNNLDVTIVGEETGGNVNLFSRFPEDDIIELKNSKLRIIHSSSYVNYKPGYKGGVKPDVEIKQNYKDYINGIDNCYEYIINN
ncbi:MAG: S41 family peptidase [Romboutsia sp.]